MDFKFQESKNSGVSLYYSESVEKLCNDFVEIQKHYENSNNTNFYRYIEKYELKSNTLDSKEKTAMNVRKIIDIERSDKDALKARKEYFSKYFLPVLFYPEAHSRKDVVSLDNLPDSKKDKWQKLGSEMGDKAGFENYYEILYFNFLDEHKILSKCREKESHKSSGYGYGYSGYGDDEKAHVDHYTESLKRAQKYGVLGRSTSDFGFDIFAEDYDSGDKEKKSGSSDPFSFGNIEEEEEKKPSKIERSSITYEMYSEFFDKCREKLVNGNYNYNENTDDDSRNSKNLNGQGNMPPSNVENKNANGNDQLQQNTHKDDYEEETTKEAQKRIDNLKKSAVGNKLKSKNTYLEKFLDLNSVNIPNYIKGLNNKIKLSRKEGASKGKPKLVGNRISKLKLEKENIKIKILKYILDAAEADFNVLRLDAASNEVIMKNLSRFLYEGDSILAECEQNYKIMKEKDTGYKNDLTSSEAYDPFWFAKYLEKNNDKPKASEIRNYYAYRASLLAIYEDLNRKLVEKLKYKKNFKMFDIYEKINKIGDIIKNSEMKIQNCKEQNNVKINNADGYMQMVEEVSFNEYAKEMKELKDNILEKMKELKGKIPNETEYDQSTIKRLEEYAREADSMGSIKEQDLEYFDDDSSLLRRVLHGEEEKKLKEKIEEEKRKEEEEEEGEEDEDLPKLEFDEDDEFGEDDEFDEDDEEEYED